MIHDVIMGLDPGVSGAVAFYFPENNLVSVYDVPVVDNQINASALSDLIDKYAPELAMVELVHSMPKQGVASTFKFGVAFGIALGVIASHHIPLRLSTPQKWKKHFKLSSDKEDARALAIQLFPKCQGFTRKKDHGRAEAALLARYAYETVT